MFLFQIIDHHLLQLELNEVEVVFSNDHNK